MAKRLDTAAGARFREWLKSCYGSIGAAAEAYEMKPESLNPYFKGDLEIGGVWIDRIESNGGDYYYILTGRRPDSIAQRRYANTLAARLASAPTHSAPKQGQNKSTQNRCEAGCFRRCKSYCLQLDGLL